MERIYSILQSAHVLSLLTKIFAIFREASGTSRGKEAGTGNHPLHQPEPVCPSDPGRLARTFYMSKNHLTAVFKRATGTTVARYILYKRMAIVRKELAMGVPAAEAASRAGFGDYSSFFQGIQKKCLAARLLIRTRRECLKWIREVRFKNVRGQM